MAQFVSLNAAADKLANGAIIVPEFQKEITDLVRRAGALGQRIQYVPATGSPSRWFDQTAIADGQFTDPNNIAPTATSPTRVEKSLTIKAITNQINYGLFDMETVAQQGIFTELKAKDLKDMVNGILRLRDKALWTGTDTVSGNQVGAGTTQQYVGLFTQITNSVTIGPNASIVDGIRTAVAKLVNDPNFAARPSAIYMNPIAYDYLEQEVKAGTNAGAIQVLQDGPEVVAGLKVRYMMTAAGLLPIIPDPFMTMDASISGVGNPPNQSPPLHNYPFAVLSEDLIEFHYVGDRNPRVFQLATQSNLAEQYVGILFGAPVAKMPANAHIVGAIQRP